MNPIPKADRVLSALQPSPEPISAYFSIKNASPKLNFPKEMCFVCQ